MIKLLAPEVQGQLRSGVAIPSLQQCVEELVLNSIDAGATCVGVRMDLEAFKVQVLDNGAGMNAEDMERVGSRYHTSKCSSLEDLDSIKSHGFRGEALASIVSMATLVEISSRPRASAKTHVKLFKDGRGMDVFEAETVRPSAGTTVIVCNFFHNMPVRRRRLDAVLEGERVKQRVEAVSLMHPSVSFSLKNDSTGAMMVQLPKAKSTYHRFVQIHGLARAEKLGEICYPYKQFEAVGYLGKEGHYNNSLQFLYVNERLLLKTRIHKLLNLLLRKLRQKPDTSDGPSVIKSPKNKNTELFGVYILNIKCSYSEYDICFEPAKTLIEFKDWDEVLLCVEEGVKAFLRQEKLMSEFSQEDLDCVSSKVYGTSRADQEEDQTRAAPPDISAMDCSIGMKLASELVHRRSTDDGACPESGLTKNKTTDTEESGQTGASVNESQTTAQVESEDSGGVKNTKMPNVHEWELSEDVRQSGSSIYSLSQLVPNDLNCTKSTGNQHATDRLQLPLESNRKISLSKLIIHNIPQIPEQSQTYKLTFPEQRFERNSHYKYLATKRKISLNTHSDRCAQNPYRDISSVPPTKICRINPCQKLSAFKESGSLDKFRRMYAQSGEMKLPRQHLQKDARGSQTSSCVLSPSSLSFCNNDLMEPKTTEAQKDGEKQSSSQNPQSFPTANENKLSFSAKLSQLKEKRKEDGGVLPPTPSNTLEKNQCLSSCNKGTEEESSCQNAAVQALSVPHHSTSPHQATTEEDSASSVWLHHYNTSVGKTVYVNRMTGLSRYDDPTEDTQVCCTSDITNMAVSVFSETGMEYRCYPFQLDVVLPFLPKSRSERLISSGLDCGDAPTESSNSLSVMYSKWKNPVFVQPPEVSVDISGGQADGLVVKIHSVLFPYRLSKAMIHSMKVIDQVDKKFLACLINTREEKLAIDGETEGNLLVLVDQHAAHERVRLENLITDSYEDIPETFGEKWLCSSTIVPPLEISVTKEELRLLRSCRSQLRSLGLEVTFSETQMPSVFVGKVPRCFLEKETNELKRGRPSIIKAIVEEYLQEQTELLLSTGRVKGTLPITVLKVLASLACHGAVKFNDDLNRDECNSLVASLSSCQLPFQCAHGRPSIAPLVDLSHLDEDPKDFQKPNLKKLRRMYEAWQLQGNI